jgi:hypothetical protein
VPIPTHAFEFIVTIFDKPEAFEKNARFVPIAGAVLPMVRFEAARVVTFVVLDTLRVCNVVVVPFSVRILAAKRFPEAAFNVKMFAYPRIFALPVKMMLDVLKPFDTARFVKSPTEVMLSCTGFVTLVATLAAATLPTRFDALILEITEAFTIKRPPVSAFVTERVEVLISPDTLSFTRVPRDVIFD